MVLTWWLAWKFQDPFISDWDGFDYTVCTVQGKPSALGLGRALFLGYNHFIWRIWHSGRMFPGVGSIPPERAYLLLRYGAIVLSGPAIAGLCSLVKELSGNRLAGFCAGLILALSPYYVMYSGRSMSEIPGFFLLYWSLWWMMRSLRRQRVRNFLLAAVAIGLSANIREFAVFYLPLIPIAAYLCGFRWRLGIIGFVLAVGAALSGMGFWILKDGHLYWDSVTNWYRLSGHERALNPVTWKNLSFFGDYSYNCSVAVVFLTPLAFGLLWIRKDLRPLLWLGALGLLADLVLIANHDLSLNPRYLLTGMVGLAPVCGWGVAVMFQRNRWQGVVIVLGILILTLVNYIQLSGEVYWQQRNSRTAAQFLRQVEKFPWNSGFIVGARTPLINFYAGVDARPYWKTISPGSGWPDEKLDEAIDDMLMAGRMVYVDFDPEIWQSGAREKSREAAGLRMISERYETTLIEYQIFRIVRKIR